MLDKLLYSLVFVSGSISNPFTPKIHNRHYLSDKAVMILKQLNEKGYYFPKSSSEYNTIRGL